MFRKSRTVKGSCDMTRSLQIDQTSQHVSAGMLHVLLQVGFFFQSKHEEMRG